MKKTPMEQQYDAIKSRHPDKILLFRLGDFYEVFNDDALETAKVLNIALTKRNGRTMCGFPHHSLDQYAYKLVDAGYKVAICDQVEDASQAKGIVKREVVSILTKGTWAENPLLDRTVNSFLAIIVYAESEVSIVFADISTGNIILRSSSKGNPVAFISNELMRYMPVETLCMDVFFHEFSIQEELKTYQENLRILPKEYFVSNDLFNVYTDMHRDKIGHFSISRMTALNGLFNYLEENHFTTESIKHLHAPIEYEENSILLMNEDTLKHLEIVYNIKDFSTKRTLFSTLNNTKTLPGARKLRRLLAAPSALFEEITAQQERTEYFFNLSGGCKAIQDLLKDISDLERLGARLMTGKILPKECLSLAESIENAEKLTYILKTASPFKDYLAAITPLDELCNRIAAVINPECSNTIDGTVIRLGINKELDSYKELFRDSKNYLIKLQEEERINTGINTLKIAYNKIYGYYIEISKNAAKNLPEHYTRKQSLVNAERFTIPELNDFEQQMMKAENDVLKLEREIYEDFLLQLQSYYHRLLPLIDFVTEVDLRSSLAVVAKKNKYIKPELNEKFDWHIKEGRHPVVEQLLSKEIFISNDTNITKKDSRVSIITGPNMAGKSTYLRQNALFAVMAQIGSYIPAESAQIAIVDQIFTRIGASDDLSAGRSTFFVEMAEAAEIIDKMTVRSLVIMDELGRGTSTLDGLSLAWAILEYILLNSDKQGKLLFSTHYHELTEIAKFSGVKNLCMAVKDSGGKPVFLRKVIEGKASKSYGINVAEMAGLNTNIIKRASEILSQLEKDQFFVLSNSKQENNLFNNEHADNNDQVKEIMFEKIKKIDPNTLTPLESLNIIYELKKEIKID